IMPVVSCLYCGEEFASLQSSVEHEEDVHAGHTSGPSNMKSNICKHCNTSFESKEELDFHFQKPKERYMKVKEINDQNPFKQFKTAHSNFLYEYRADYSREEPDPLVILSEYKKYIEELLAHILSKLKCIKFELCLNIKFSLASDDPNSFKNGYIFSEAIELTNEDSISSSLESAYSTIIRLCNQREEEGSKWVFHHCFRIDVNIGKFKPSKGGCRSHNLPRELINKKAIISFLCDDNKCLIWCIAAATCLYENGLFVTPRWDRCEQFKEYFNQINIDCISFPTPINEIQLLEERNNLSINVYAFDQEIIPFRISKNRNERVINVLFFEKHYFWIKNFNKFCGRSGDRYNKYCYWCMHGFNDIFKFRKHELWCRNFSPTKLSVPGNNEAFLNFSNYERMLDIPFIIVADFESILLEKSTLMEKLNPFKSNTTNYREHLVYSYCYAVIDIDGNIVKMSGGKGKNAVDMFLIEMEHIYSNIIFEIRKNLKLEWDTYLNVIFEKETHCHICNQQFILNKNPYFSESGEYIATLHLQCLPDDYEKPTYYVFESDDIYIHENKTRCDLCGKRFNYLNKMENILSSLNEICFILDVQGFHIRNTFYARELAFVNNGGSFVIEFDTGLNPVDLTPEELTSINYVQKFLHGLSLRAHRVGSSLKNLSSSCLRCVCKYIYDKFRSQNKWKVGVKNFHLKKILDEENIPYVDLDDEIYHCPKLATLDAFYGSNKWTCAYHKLYARSNECRCALRKGTYLQRWIMPVVSCLYCGEEFASLQSSVEHEEDVHAGHTSGPSNMKSNICKHCNTSFESKEELDFHFQ
ncbi:uncharacterized protein B4U79_16862, partial [Dinothrombium tinctorium]